MRSVLEGMSSKPTGIGCFLAAMRWQRSGVHRSRSSMGAVPKGMCASASLRCDLLPSMRASAQTTRAPLKHKHAPPEIERAPLYPNVSTSEGHTPAPPFMRALLARMRAPLAIAATPSLITARELSPISHAPPITSRFPHTMFSTLPLMVRAPPCGSLIP